MNERELRDVCSKTPSHGDGERDRGQGDGEPESVSSQAGQALRQKPGGFIA
jgi:hypothetical protein